MDGDGAVVLMVVHIIRKQNDEHAQSEKKRERATERQRKRQRVAIVVVLGGGGIREANEQNIYNGREKAHFWQSSSLKNNFRRRIIFFLEKESQYLATSVLSSGLFVVHDAVRRGQDDVAVSDNNKL